MMFHIIEGGFGILYSKGVYRQVKLYRRGGTDLFAQYGGGFVRLMKHGTTVPNVLVDEIMLPPELTLNYDKLGRANISQQWSRAKDDIR